MAGIQNRAYNLFSYALFTFHIVFCMYYFSCCLMISANIDSSLSTWIGFAICPFIPAATASLLSSSNAFAVIAIIDIHILLLSDSKTILNKMQVYCPAAEDKTLPFEFQSPLSVLLLSASIIYTWKQIFQCT